MISYTAAAGIAAVALGLVLTPGPNMVYLVSRSVAQGRRAGLVSLGGVAAGFVIYVAAATAGLATLFALVPAAYTALKAAGVLYLLWLAWRAARPGGTPFAARDLPADPARRLFAMGLVTSLLNPKIAVLYISLLPQFVDPARGHVALQSLLLGLTQIAVAVTVNGLIVLGAGGIADLLRRRPAWERAQRCATAAVLAAMAVRLGLDRARPLPA
ncbi:LysE family translocator [Spirillospora albida]|uniref:LysE family translocator n=1 Tax=Spirillospora albida TaxID=58123 RepID=UPI0004BF5E79|nr:LysE family translocator [Spirillospora albida]